MGISKVDFNGETLVDLTKDTVNENSLLAGYSAHNAAGEPVDGAVTVVPTTTSLAVTEEGVSALDGTVGKVLDDKGAQINVYKGDDGNLHFRDWSGADTAIPFSVIQNFQVVKTIQENNTYNASWTADKDYKSLFLILAVSGGRGENIVSINGKEVAHSTETTYCYTTLMEAYFFNNVRSGDVVSMRARNVYIGAMIIG